MDDAQNETVQLHLEKQFFLLYFLSHHKGQGNRLFKPIVETGSPGNVLSALVFPKGVSSLRN